MTHHRESAVTSVMNVDLHRIIPSIPLSQATQLKAGITDMMHAARESWHDIKMALYEYGDQFLAMLGKDVPSDVVDAVSWVQGVVKVQQEILTTADGHGGQVACGWSPLKTL